MYLTGTPTVALRTPMGACCSGCAQGGTACGEVQLSTNVVGAALAVGVAWLVIKSMKRVSR